MTPQEINIAIAEACGWKIIRRDITGYNVWEPGAEHPARLTNNLEGLLPNYHSSLDAMHEAEKVLSRGEWHEYYRRLYLKTRPKNHVVTPGCDDHTRAFIHARASQRAEAFLRTKGLWHD
jgi:hypothetical protein